MEFSKKIILALSLLLTISTASYSQDEIDKFLEGSVSDGEKLIGAYVSPLMKSLSTGLNQGWYNTAKPHKVAGFDLTVTVNAMSIPDKEQFFNVDALNLEELELDETTPDPGLSPTVFGPDRPAVFAFKSQPGETFDGPSGLDMKKEIGMNVVPLPMAQLGFGLPKGTDLKIRFVPEITFEGNSKFNMFGIGVMHDIKQWIPGIKMAPFDLSGFIGYTKLKMTSDLDEPNTEDARGVFEMSGVTVQGLISKKMSVLTVYGGLGYNISKSKLAMQGKYDINDDGDYADTREVNPVNLDFSASGPRMTAGFRLKLAVITLHADYTLQKYNCLSVGFGINVR